MHNSVKWISLFEWNIKMCINSIKINPNEYTTVLFSSSRILGLHWTNWLHWIAPLLEAEWELRAGGLCSWQGQHAVEKIIHLANGLWEVSAERLVKGCVLHYGIFFYNSSNRQLNTMKHKNWLWKIEKGQGSTFNFTSKCDSRWHTEESMGSEIEPKESKRKV